MNSYGRDVQNRFTRERLMFDQDVHLAIAELAGNETLMSTLSHVFERIVLKRRTDGLYDPARGMAAHQEHLLVLEAIERRDADEAVADSSQPHSSRQKKRHDRSPTAASDSRTPSY